MVMMFLSRKGMALVAVILSLFLFPGISAWQVLEEADPLFTVSVTYTQAAPRMPAGEGRGPGGSRQQPFNQNSFRPNESGQAPDGSGKPPTGDGRPQEEPLPEDRLPDTSGYEFPEELYPYRTMLSDAEQTVYDQIYANAVEFYESMPLHAQLSTNSLERVMTAVFCDHPELFWLDTSYEYGYTAQGYAVSVTLSFNSTANSIDTHKDRFDAEAENVLSAARTLSSVYEKEKYIHDYLIDHVVYDPDAPLNQSAYSALVSGETVCAGYARAFQYLMQQLEIPCYYCTGYAGESHAWNIVALDSGYYNVDVAWDDTAGDGGYCYDYFNITDAVFAKTHTRSGLSEYLPSCNATKYQFAA